MLKAVLDTNVLISSTINPHGPSHRIVASFLEGHFNLITSAEIIAEVIKVLKYPRIADKYRITNSDIQIVVNRLLAKARLVVVIDPPKIIKEDAEDNFILGCAEVSQADYIVSGDEHLLNLNQYKNIKIVSPRRFLEILF